MDVEALYQEHYAILVRYLLRCTADSDRAVDIAQEAYLRLVERPPAQDVNIRAWLFTVATNIVRDGWRRDQIAKRLSDVSRSSLASDSAPDPHTTLESDERRRLVRQMLRRLSLKERTILLMREAGFNHREIAEAVGTTRRSIPPTIARALDKLADDIDRLRETLR